MIRIKNKQRLITKIITDKYVAFSIYKYTTHKKNSHISREWVIITVKNTVRY